MSRILGGYTYGSAGVVKFYPTVGVVTPPTNTVDPTIDAGSAVVGTANYTVPTSNVIFMSPTGSDAGAGTQAAPKKSLTAAMSAVPAGGTIVMRGGTYFEGTDTQGGALTLGVSIGKSVTIQNYPGEAVWLDGSQVLPTWTASGGFWFSTYDRLFDRSPTYTSGQADGTNASSGQGGVFLTAGQEQACWPDMILVDGTQYTQVQNQADLGPGKFWVNGANTGNGFWFQATQVWLGDDPTGHEVRAAYKVRCMVVTGSNVTIRGIGVRRYATSQPAQGAIYHTGESCLLENVWLEDFSCQALQWNTAGSCQCVNVTSKRTGANFASATESDGLVFDLCDISDVNAGPVQFNIDGPSIAAFKCSKMQGITVKRSKINNVGGAGVWGDRTVDKMWVYSSRISNVSKDGVDYEGSSYGIGADLFLDNVGLNSIWMNDSDQLRIYNVTIRNARTRGGTGGAFDIGQSDRNPATASWSWMKDERQPASYWDDPAHQYHVHHFEFCNVAAAGTAGTSIWYFAANSDTYAQTTWAGISKVMDGNVYWWNATPQYPFVIHDYGSSSQIYGGTFNAFSQLWTVQGVEQHSTLLTGSGNSPLNANGQLVNQTYHGNAVALPADIAAMIGQLAGTKHVGAFLVGDPS